MPSAEFVTNLTLMEQVHPSARGVSYPAQVQQASSGLITPVFRVQVQQVHIIVSTSAPGAESLSSIQQAGSTCSEGQACPGSSAAHCKLAVGVESQGRVYQVCPVCSAGYCKLALVQ